MEALLPLLQMRAQMLQDSNMLENRQRYTSTASSIPSSPTTPLSPSNMSPFMNCWMDNNYQQQQQHAYLNQLAAINMQLQQRRLLHSSTSSPNPLTPALESPTERKKNIFNFEPELTRFKPDPEPQEEPIDLSSTKSQGRESSTTLDTMDALETPSIKSEPDTEHDSRLETQSDISESPLVSGRKRSRSTSFEELQFEESEDDDVFEKSPLPALDPKPAFRPYEKGVKRRFSVPAPLPLPSLPLNHSLPSAHSLPSPYSSPHFPFSPHIPFMDQISPFTPHFNSVFRFPPPGSFIPPDWLNSSPKFPPASPLDLPPMGSSSFPPTQAESEARRLFLSRLHSTVLKLERREDDEEETAGRKQALAGYQVQVQNYFNSRTMSLKDIIYFFLLHY